MVLWGTCLTAAAFGGNWPQFRGPTGDGHGLASGIPLRWSERENVRWKTPIHDRGWSSPVLWGREIWLTTADRDGTRLFGVCVDLQTGRILHDLKLFEVEKPQAIDPGNSYASPTPVIESNRVYVSFGAAGTACIETSHGRVLWTRRDLPCQHRRGAGSSPILHGSLLIMHFDGGDEQYVVALDHETGRTVWRTARSTDFKDLGADGKPVLDGDLRKAFATPHVAEVGGRPTLISLGSKAAYGYVPETGRELWRVNLLENHSACTRPVAGSGLVFLPNGINQPKLLAIRTSATTRVEVAWVARRNVPHKPSLLLSGELLFMVDDAGVASCLDAQTGREIWRERLGGNYSASPVLVEGRLYFFSEEGKTTVIDANRRFRILAENRLAEGCMASPAVTDGALVLRTKTALYCIAQ